MTWPMLYFNTEGGQLLNTKTSRYFPSAFPELVPWGIGGLGDPDQQVTVVSFQKHLLDLKHRSFAKNENFIVVAFSTIQ